MSDLRDRFRELHASGTFVMPNPWDIGTARRLAELGFPALATTSAGHAASLGKRDGQVTRDELVAHVATLTSAVDLPLNVDAERCFSICIREQPIRIRPVATRVAGAGCFKRVLDVRDGIGHEPKD